MRKTLSAILVARESLFAVLLVLSLATAGFGDTFTFGFNGPRAIVGGLGETVGVTYQMTLCHDNPEGKPLAIGGRLVVERGRRQCHEGSQLRRTRS